MDINIKEILNHLKVSAGLCEYWDIRVEETYESEIKYEDFELTGCSIKPSLGAFIRVYQKGMWHYSSTTELHQLPEQIFELSKQAQKFTVEKNTPPIRPYNTGPFQEDLIKSQELRVDKVATHQKRKLCESYFEDIKSFEKLKNIKVSYVDEYKIKYFRSSTDIQYAYDFNQCGLSISYTVTDEQDGRFDDRVTLYGSQIDNLRNKNSHIKEQIEESHLFTQAKTIEAGEYPVAMNSEIVGVFAHESFGHKSEADFMIGDEEAKETWKLGKKVGHECLSIVDYGAERGTSGYCPMDDEGFPTQKTYLIKKGILTGRLHSQQTSQLLDEAPTGNGRSINFEFEPIVRMTNTYVEPGQGSFEELISQVKLGVLAKSFRHGSGMSTFTIAPLRCYMIKDGKIAEPVRVSVLSGSVFETLQRIEGCSQDYRLESFAFGGCGKGEQAPLPVGFGGPYILVNKMVVS